MDNGRNNLGGQNGESMPFFTAGSGVENPTEVSKDPSNPNLSLEGWMPDRDPRTFGGKVNEAIFAPATDQSAELGKITDLPDFASHPVTEVAAPIPLTWTDREHGKLSAATIHAVKDREQKLAMTGDIAAFYRDIRATAESEHTASATGGQA